MHLYRSMGSGPMLFAAASMLALAGCASGGSKPGSSFTPPTMPEDVSGGSLPLSGGSLTASGGGTADPSRVDALDAEVQALRTEFDALKPSINRLVRVERDMSELLVELEQLVGEPQPFAPATPGAPTRVKAEDEVPAPSGQPDAPVLTLADAAPPKPLASASEPDGPPAPPRPEPVLSGAAALNLPSDVTVIDKRPAPSAAKAETAALTLNGKPPAPIASPPAAPDGPAKQCGGFGAHLGSFKGAGNVETAKSEYARKYPAQLGSLSYKVVDVTVGSDVFHRLNAGPLSQAEAKALCSTIAAGGDYCATARVSFEGCS